MQDTTHLAPCSLAECAVLETLTNSVVAKKRLIHFCHTQLC